MPEATPTLEQALGARLRTLREASGLRQDDIAERARRQGLEWNRATVAAFEAGRRHADLGECLLLCRALGISLPELLAGEQTVAITPEASAALRGLRAVASGQGRVAVSDFDVPDTQRLNELRDDALLMFRGYHHLWPDSNAGQLVGAKRAASGAAEEKGAAKLGVDPIALSTVAHRLWNRSLTEERDQRVAASAPSDASPRTLQALRGHVTRQLLEELGQDPLLSKEVQRGQHP